MKPSLYELCWQVETDAHSFIYREFKVFRSVLEIGEYGKKREFELNDGMSIKRRSQDGFYYKFIGSHEVEHIDGFGIRLRKQ